MRHLNKPTRSTYDLREQCAEIDVAIARILVGDTIAIKLTQIKSILVSEEDGKPRPGKKRLRAE